MIFTLDNLIDSLAGVLKEKYPSWPVYDSPLQQGTNPPCFFIFFMPSTIEGHVGERYIRDLGVDLVFVQQRHTVNGNRELIRIAEFLDENLEVFRYTGGAGTAWIRTFEREWQTEDQELHYKFHIRQRVKAEEEAIFMERMEENHVGIKEDGS